jgi:ubiquinone/menaquinone biosynthesis C-methylase UbiE
MTEKSHARIVLEKNREFYDKIAPHYEKVDLRRERDHPWIDQILSDLKSSFKNPTILDVGAGSGFFAKKAVRFFAKVIATDLSQAMLDKIQDPKIETICCSCEQLNVKNESVEVVAAFATLHHLFDPEKFFQEAHRVLKSGGILYTDHDIESHFVANFRWPLKLYRYFFDHGPKYIAACPSLKLEEYHITEWHGDDGLDAKSLELALKKIGFREVRVEYHWQGLLPFTPFWRICGLSPLMRILAVK